MVASASPWLPSLPSLATFARRLFLDRQAELWLGRSAPASANDTLSAKVVEIIRETHDVKTFVLEVRGEWAGHRAGQWVPIELEIDGVRVRRCYSISSAPTESGAKRRIAITVKRVPSGRVSTFMHDELARGDVIGVDPAQGDFVLSVPAPRKTLLLSGGSGITPVMSILRDLAANGRVEDVVFIHCARSRRDVVFERELTELATRHPGLRVVTVLDDAARGRLDAPMLAALLPDFAEREAWLCGPTPMMDAMTAVWTARGAESRLRTERFVSAPRPSILAGAMGRVDAKVYLMKSGRTVAAGGEGTLLDQLERAGEQPKFGCRMGICNTCRCRKKSGVVVDTTTGAVSGSEDEDIRLCVSVAQTDLELSL